MSEALETLRAKRRALKCTGWGDTPALDEDIAALEKVLSQSDQLTSISGAIKVEAITGAENHNPADLGGIDGRSGEFCRVWSPCVSPQHKETPVPAIARKLTPDQVHQIRELNKLAQAGLGNQRAIAAHFGLSQSTVSDICSGKKWKLVPAVEWKPSLVLVDTKATAETMDTEGGTYGSHETGVVTLPGAQDRSSAVAEAGDEENEAAQ